MSKRLKRVSVAEIPKYLQDSQFLNFVLKDRSVQALQPSAIKSNHLKARNSRNHHILIPLDQIEEIWVEEKVS